VNRHADEPAVFHWVRVQKNIPLFGFEQVAKVLKITISNATLHWINFGFFKFN